MNIDNLTNYMYDVAQLFNTSDPYYHAQSIAVQILWLVDENNDKRVDRYEWEKFLHGLTLTADYPQMKWDAPAKVAMPNILKSVPILKSLIY